MKNNKYLIELNARNIVNIKDISDYINHISSNIKTVEIKNWVSKQVKEYLQNDIESVEKVTKSKSTDPDWLKNSVKEGTALKVELTDNFKDNTNLILTYLDIIDDKKELSKIYKIKYKEMLDKANYYFINNDSKDITVVREYKSGFKWVTLDSLHAFNRETKLMNHCISTDPEYVKKLESGKGIYYSLRSSSNKPHCTIEVEKRQIIQIKGHSDGPVIQKYVRYVLDFIKNPIENKYKKIQGKNDLMNIGCILQKGVLHNIYKLLDGFIYNGTLDYTDDKYLKKLPDNLTIKRHLNLTGTNITELPKNLSVGGSIIARKTLNLKKIHSSLKTYDLDLSESGIEELPDELILKRDLNLVKSKVKKLPSRLKIKGSLYIEKTDITELPEGLTCSFLSLEKTDIKELPKVLNIDNLILSKKITFLPKNFKCNGSVTFSSSSITELPEGLNIKEFYVESINNGKLEKLPENLVTDRLDLTGTKIKELPKKLKIKELHLSETIKELPSDIKVDLLIIPNYSELVKLTKNLKVKTIELSNYLGGKDLINSGTVIEEDLSISESNIPSIPSDLKIGRSLYMDTTLISSLPENLNLQNLNISRCKNLKTLPENIKVSESFIAIDSVIEELPENFNCKLINISNSKVKKLPENLKIEELRIDNSDITELPKKLIVDTLYLYNSKVTFIPKEITIKKNLVLPESDVIIEEGIDLSNIELNTYKSKIKKLPNNLTVRNLLLNTKIKKLPKNLTILDRDNSFVIPTFSPITEIPSDFKCNAKMYFKRSRIKKIPKNFKFLNSVNFESSELTVLSENMEVNGDLNLKYCKMEYLPENLTVKGDLEITNLNSNKIPDSIKIDGMLYMPLNKILDNVWYIPEHLKSKVDPI